MGIALFPSPWINICFIDAEQHALISVIATGWISGRESARIVFPTNPVFQSRPDCRIKVSQRSRVGIVITLQVAFSAQDFATTYVNILAAILFSSVEVLKQLMNALVKEGSSHGQRDV